MLTIACAVLVAFASGGEGSGGEKPGKKTQIVCKSRALIRGTRILVGDLVDILPPGEEAHRIGQIPFGVRPASGFSRIVTKHVGVHAHRCAPLCGFWWIQSGITRRSYQ